ncbi:MAG: 1-deoxy-D-xylulose-5-phosphate synthase N-terminal domain-containing protein [Microthrixaceae bacterium]
MREIFEPPAFFENLGVRYVGPFDGHDIAGLERALRNGQAIDGPVVVHVLTQKGRGYAPAENDQVKDLHDMGEVKPGSYTAAFTEAMLKEGERRPELVAITAAMPDSTGLLPFGERFPGRSSTSASPSSTPSRRPRGWPWAASAPCSPCTPPS